MDASILDDAHHYWFGHLAGPTDYPDDKAGLWFKGGAEVDVEIRERFGESLDGVVGNDWDVSALTRTQQLGLVIYLDQFTRNLFRKSGEAFAHDDKARRVANTLIGGGLDRFHLCERAFVLMPLMHSEDVRDQDRCLMLFAQQALTASGDFVDRFRSYLDFACWHRDLIRKFGRFPHRNAVLGRESTEAERKHLEEKGRGY